MEILGGLSVSDVEQYIRPKRGGRKPNRKTPQRFALLEDKANLMATLEEIENVWRCVDAGLKLDAVAERLNMREIDVLLIVLDELVDEDTGSVMWCAPNPNRSDTSKSKHGRRTVPKAHRRAI